MKNEFRKSLISQGLRVCPKCKTTKWLTDFSCSYCRPCKKVYLAAWKQAHPNYGMSCQVRYSAVVETGWWTPHPDGTNTYAETLNCGHKHRSVEAAERCLASKAKYFAWAFRTAIHTLDGHRAYDATAEEVEAERAEALAILDEETGE